MRKTVRIIIFYSISLPCALDEVPLAALALQPKQENMGLKAFKDVSKQPLCSCNWNYKEPAEMLKKPIKKKYHVKKILTFYLNFFFYKKKHIFETAKTMKYPQPFSK